MIVDNTKINDVTSIAIKAFRLNKDASRVVLMNIQKNFSLLQARGVMNVKVMDFCGTHEWAITYYGIRSLMPKGVELIAGPGCPVCITPATFVEEAIKLALDGIRVYVFGDAYKLPSTSLKKPRSLFEAAAMGANVKVVYGFLDAVKDAKEYGKEALFLGIGFETTAPSYAIPFKHGIVPKNLKFLSALRLTPPIMRHALDINMKKYPTHKFGVIAPGHVSTVIGASAWEFLPREYKIPTVVAGFEPLDLLIAIEKILEMMVNERPGIFNEYARSVTWEGNIYAKKAIEEVFEVVDAAWRGIGVVPKSGLVLSEKFKEWDAVREYGIKEDIQRAITDPPGCRCGEVSLGLIPPTQCPMFMKVCTPERPYGPCMVSEEGTCRIWALYGGYAEL